MKNWDYLNQQEKLVKSLKFWRRNAMRHYVAPQFVNYYSQKKSARWTDFFHYLITYCFTTFLTPITLPSATALMKYTPLA